MIYIVGTGAIGKCLAAFLKLSGKEVTLIRGSLDDQPDSLETIHLQLPADIELRAEVRVQTFSNLDAIEGAVLVASKAFGNPTIASKLAVINSRVPIVLLQNGLNVEQPFLDMGFQSLYRCVLMVTAQFTGNGHISFKPVATCPVGVISGDTSELADVLEHIENPWFTFSPEKEIQTLIWKKVISNCVFNSICPLLETDNGIFNRDPSALELAERIIEECVRVAKRCNISINTQEVRSVVLNISQRSEGQLISTLQDIRQGRPTEIDMLNGEIVRLARQYNIEDQVQQTRILGELIAIKSQL